MSEPSRFRGRDLAAAILAVLIALGGLAALHFVPAPRATAAAAATAGDDAEAQAEFRSELKDDGKSVRGMIADTKAGKNVTDFRLGMFAMSLLNTLSDEDDTLGAYFHKDGRLMEDYLRNTFQYHSEDEVAHVADLAKQGHPAIRQSARYALEALRHIPEDKDAPAEQEKDRQALIESLTALEASLDQAAKE